MLECRSLTKTFGAGRAAHTALQGVSLTFERGVTCALLGPSGSGKTTLLSILGCLLSPTSGALLIDGRMVRHNWTRQLTDLRRRLIGFVFQSANLLPFLTIEQNLLIVGRNSGLTSQDVAQRLDALCERLNIQALRSKYPSEASGGERQRVAIARAVLHRPKILLADEPTAALDWENGQRVVTLLTEQAHRDDAVLITVTHDPRVAEAHERVLHMDSGRIADP